MQEDVRETMYDRLLREKPHLTMLPSADPQSDCAMDRFFPEGWVVELADFFYLFLGQHHAFVPGIPCMSTRGSHLRNDPCACLSGVLTNKSTARYNHPRPHVCTYHCQGC